MYANGGVNGGVDTPPGVPGPGRPRHGGRPAVRIAALIVACAVVTGGAFAVTEAVSSPGQGNPAGTAAAAAAPASDASSGAAGQAAVLNGALGDVTLAASTGTDTASQPGAVPTATALRRLRRALARLRRLGGMYGQFTFETKNGPRTVAFERGTIISVAGADVTVRAADGLTWTWLLTGTSVVREDGSRIVASKLAAGQLVFAGGPVSGTTRDAELIVIRTAGTSGKSAEALG